MPVDHAPAALRAEGGLDEEVRVALRILDELRSVADETAEGLIIFRIAPRLSMAAWARLAAEIDLAGWLAAPLSGAASPLMTALRRVCEDAAGRPPHDAPPGLGDRRFFERSLDVEMERAAHSGAPMSLVLLQLDDYAERLDAHGPDVLENAVIGVAGILIGLKRRYDLAARLADDRLALILSGAGLYEAKAVMDKALAATGDLPLLPGDRLTCSAGLACYKGRQPLTPRELQELAERALAQAKAQGGGRTVCAPIPDMAASPKSALVQANEKQFLFFGG